MWALDLDLDLELDWENSILLENQRALGLAFDLDKYLAAVMGLK